VATWGEAGVTDTEKQTLLQAIREDPQMLESLRILRGEERLQREPEKPLPPGPWSDEPDYLGQFMYGFFTEVRRTNLGHLCGYIHIPETHPWFKENNPRMVDVHGGVTFSARDSILGTWVLGFDCGHHGDLAPALLITLGSNPGGTYRTVRYVLEELDRWARDAAQAASGIHAVSTG
jgi:hypothetical protein